MRAGSRAATVMRIARRRISTGIAARGVCFRQCLLRFADLHAEPHVAAHRALAARAELLDARGSAWPRICRPMPMRSVPPATGQSWCGRMHSVGPDQLHGFSERNVGDCGPNWLGVDAPGTRGSGRSTGASAAQMRTTSRPDQHPPLRGRASPDTKWSTTRRPRRHCERLASWAGRGRRATTPLPACRSATSCRIARSSRGRWTTTRSSGRVGLNTLPRRQQMSIPGIAKWRRRMRSTTIADRPTTYRARTAYYGLVRALDAKIGRILDALETAGLAENTLIIYASDHGEQLGERELWWKNTFYEDRWRFRWSCRGRAASVREHFVADGATWSISAPRMIAAAGRRRLPRSRRPQPARDRQPTTMRPWVDETFSEYVTDLSRPGPGRRRLPAHVRTALEICPHRRLPAATLRSRRPTRTRCTTWATIRLTPRCGAASRRALLAGWNPDAIRREVDARCEEKALLASGGRNRCPEPAVSRSRDEGQLAGKPD